MGIKLENFLYTPVLKFYWQNKQLKEEVFFSGIIRHVKNNNSLYLLINILKSIYRLKIFLTFKKNDPNIFSIKYGLKSLTQKKIVNAKEGDVEYFNKLPMGPLSLSSLKIESEAIKVFNELGIKTMHKIPNKADFCYSAVNGVNKYMPNLIYTNCVLKYPNLAKITIGNYFLDNEFFQKNKYDLNYEIELTISHGDLTVWNTFYDNKNFILIDLECFKELKIKYFDIFYYIISYEFYVNKNNYKVIYEKFNIFIQNHKIEKIYLILFFYDLLQIKKNDLNDGFFKDIKSRFINEITQLIDIYEIK